MPTTTKNSILLSSALAVLLFCGGALCSRYAYGDEPGNLPPVSPASFAGFWPRDFDSPGDNASIDCLHFENFVTSGELEFELENKFFGIPKKEIASAAATECYQSTKAIAKEKFDKDPYTGTSYNSDLYSSKKGYNCEITSSIEEIPNPSNNKTRFRAHYKSSWLLRHQPFLGREKFITIHGEKAIHGAILNDTASGRSSEEIEKSKQFLIHKMTQQCKAVDGVLENIQYKNKGKSKWMVEGEWNSLADGIAEQASGQDQVQIQANCAGSFYIYPGNLEAQAEKKCQAEVGTGGKCWAPIAGNRQKPLTLSKEASQKISLYAVDPAQEKKLIAEWRCNRLTACQSSGNAMQDIKAVQAIAKTCVMSGSKPKGISGFGETSSGSTDSSSNPAL